MHGPNPKDLLNRFFEPFAGVVVCDRRVSVEGVAMSNRVDEDLSSLRILVAIAGYGEKNRRFLEQTIRTYRSLPFETNVVVLSEAPKDLGADVEVVVGLPTRDPWSLGFAHK